MLPEGARGYAGIGCHWLAQFVPGRKTEGATHMGGEGANWVGEAPFSTRGHVFQNMGDGTYNHSGLMAIRHAVATGTTITYKILFNDAVAMTGGQRNDGGLTVEQIAQQMRAIGVERIAVVSDEPDKYPSRAAFPAYTSFHHRSELQAVQTEMMGVKGVSVLIYDQTCAAEKRRRRTQGRVPRSAASASSSTSSSARAAAIAACSRIAWRSSRSRPSSAASARSTSRPATRISPASRASARAS